MSTGLDPLIAKREVQRVGGEEKQASKLLLYTGEVGHVVWFWLNHDTDDALPPSYMKLSSSLAALITRCLVIT